MSRGSFVVIALGLVGLLVALHAQMSHAGPGDDLQRSVHHAEARAQNGHEGHLAARDLLGIERRDGRLDEHVRERQVAGGLVGLEQRELAHDIAELVGRGVLVAQDGQLVLHDGVIEDDDAVVPFHNLVPFVRCGGGRGLRAQAMARFAEQSTGLFQSLRNLRAEAPSAPAPTQLLSQQHPCRLFAAQPARGRPRPPRSLLSQTQNLF